MIYQNQRRYHIGIFKANFSIFIIETWTTTHLDEGRRTLGTELAQPLKDFSILNCKKILASFPLIVAGSSLLKKSVILELHTKSTLVDPNLINPGPTFQTNHPWAKESRHSVRTISYRTELISLKFEYFQRVFSFYESTRSYSLQ